MRSLRKVRLDKSVKGIMREMRGGDGQNLQLFNMSHLQNRIARYYSLRSHYPVCRKCAKYLELCVSKLKIIPDLQKALSFGKIRS